jgi:hypothetical protein
MRRRDFLVGGLAAILGAGVVGCNARSREVQRSLEWEDTGKLHNVESIRKAGREYLYDFFKRYVPFMEVHSKEIRENAVTHGGAEGLAKVYVEIHGRCLDLAAESFTRTVKDEEVRKLGRELARFQGREAVRTYIDYSHHAVVKGYEEFAKERFRFFREVIKRGNGKRAENFRDLLRRGFSREELKSEVESYVEKSDELYKGFAQSLKDYKGHDESVKVFGPLVVWSTKERNDDFYRDEVKRIYGR